MTVSVAITIDWDSTPGGQETACTGVVDVPAVPQECIAIRIRDRKGKAISERGRIVSCKELV